MRYSDVRGAKNYEYSEEYSRSRVFIAGSEEL